MALDRPDGGAHPAGDLLEREAVEHQLEDPELARREDGDVGGVHAERTRRSGSGFGTSRLGLRVVNGVPQRRQVRSRVVARRPDFLAEAGAKAMRQATEQ